MKKERTPVQKIVLVEWLDPATYTGWTSAKKARTKKPGRVLSAGLLIGEDKENLLLALDSLDGGKEFNGVGVIPKSAVLRVRRIPVPPGMRHPKR